MNHTTNLHLPQWEETDRIQMDDFNDAMERLDTAVAAAPRIATGTYAGNGAETQTINLGFTPKIVIIWQEGFRQYSDYIYGGIATADYPCGTANAITIVSNGFCVKEGSGIHTNENTGKYIYLAIG